MEALIPLNRSLATKRLTCLSVILLTACGDNTGGAENKATGCDRPEVAIETIEGPLTTRKTLTYDGRGNIISELVKTFRTVNGIINPSADTSVWTYDSENRKLTQERGVDGGDDGLYRTLYSTTWDYDSRGHILSELTNSTQENVDELVTGGTESYFTYDVNGNELTNVINDYSINIAMPDLTSTRTSTYDAQGNKLTEQFEKSNLNSGSLWRRDSVQSTFDSVGNELSRQVETWSSYYGTGTPDEVTYDFTWGYDNNGKKLTEVKTTDWDSTGPSPANTETRFWSYNVSGRTTLELYTMDRGSDGTLEEKIETQWVFDSNGAVLSKVATTDENDDGSTEISESTHWTYDAQGHLLSMIEKFVMFRSPFTTENKTQTWTYDNQGRTLTSDVTYTGTVLHSNKSTTYTYNDCFISAGLLLEESPQE